MNPALERVLPPDAFLRSNDLVGRSKGVRRAKAIPTLATQTCYSAHIDICTRMPDPRSDIYLSTFVVGPCLILHLKANT